MHKWIFKYEEPSSTKFPGFKFVSDDPTATSFGFTFEDKDFDGKFDYTESTVTLSIKKMRSNFSVDNITQILE